MVCLTSTTSSISILLKLGEVVRRKTKQENTFNRNLKVTNFQGFAVLVTGETCLVHRLSNVSSEIKHVKKRII